MHGKRAVKKNESGRACGHAACPGKRWCRRTIRRSTKRAIRQEVTS